MISVVLQIGNYATMTFVGITLYLKSYVRTKIMSDTSICSSDGSSIGEGTGFMAFRSGAIIGLLNWAKCISS